MRILVTSHYIYSISSGDRKVEVNRHQVEVGFERMINAAESGGGGVSKMRVLWIHICIFVL
jgi:hypothetical protein